MTRADDEHIERDAMLLRYIDGECSPEEQATIEQDPVLWQQMEELRQLDDWLRRAFATGRPLQTQPPAASPEMMRNVEQLFADSGNEPSGVPDGPHESLTLPVLPLKRVVHSVQVRGHSLRFEAPDVTLNLRQEPVPGEDSTWILRGWLEREGEGCAALVVLASLEGGIPRRAYADEEGLFRFANVPEGVYDLRLILEDKELRLSQLHVP